VTADESFKDRVWEGFNERRKKDRKFGQDQLGAEVGELLGGDPIQQGTVSRWFRGSIPDLETIIALAHALDCHPGWLAFGERGGAEPPRWVTPPVSGDGGVDSRAKGNLPLARAARKQPPRDHRRSG